MTLLAEQAAKLLDFGQKLDIQLLDSVVACMYAAEGEQVGVRVVSLEDIALNNTETCSSNGSLGNLFCFCVLA